MKFFYNLMAFEVNFEFGTSNFMDLGLSKINLSAHLNIFF